MNTASNSVYFERMLRRTAALSSISLSLLCASVAYGDPPKSMAPPISADSAVTGAEQGTIDQTTVFNWTQVPKNQTIALTRATFDKGGYQLYDTAGETILVPFAGDNLYVMRFARSNSDTMYFENQADTPVLYVPVGDYLENATVPGGRWYPITDNFQPTTPVYMGIAPTWDDFIGMGWFSGCVCNGGYYCDVGFGGGSYVPCPGYIFVVGHNRCFGWSEYRDYCIDHNPRYHTGYFDHRVYVHSGNDSRRFAGSDHRNFGTLGGGGFESNHNSGQPDRFSSDSRHEFRGTGVGTSGSSHGSSGDTHNFNGQNHSFNGTSHSSNSGGNSPSSHSSSAGLGSQSSGGPFGDSGRSSGGGGGFYGGGHSSGGGFGGGGGGFGGHGR